jgi:hypothetical protein
MFVGQGNPQMPTDGSSTANGQPVTPSNGEDVWDEERIEEALKTLKEMHIQVGSWQILMDLYHHLLMLDLVAGSTNHHSKAHCPSDYQATLT